MASDPFDRFLREALAKSQLLAQRTAQWRERNQRQLDAVVQSLRAPAVRAATWVNAHQGQIAAVLEGLDRFNRLADEIEGEWADAGLGYLVSPLGMAEHLMLSLYAPPGEADELLDFLEVALADPGFIERTGQGSTPPRCSPTFRDST